MIDELAATRGCSVILRGHDLRLRCAPRHREGTRPAAGQSAFTLRMPRHAPETAASLTFRCGCRAIIRFWIPRCRRRPLSNWPSGIDMSAVALTDTGNLHGAVEFVQAAKRRASNRSSARNCASDDQPLLLYVESATRLSQPLSAAVAPRGSAAGMTKLGGRPSNASPSGVNECDGLTDGLIAVSEDSGVAEMFPGRFYGWRPGQTRPGISGGGVSGDSLCHAR